jgi:uncharacterized membrane protein YphA (DoxX/SURF4 family)
MGYLLISLTLFSSLSFIAYSISYFISPHMKSEFERFNLKHIGLFIIILEILGAIGLLVGIFFKPILLISSGGLSLLMFFGFMTRVKLKDSFLVSFPAIFLMILNGYIFYLGIAK